MTWTARVLHTSGSDLLSWRNYYDRLKQKGIYHSPEYIRILEKQYRDEAELFVYGNKEEFVYYPYFKKCLSQLPFEDKYVKNLSDYFDIVSSWYYGGPLVQSGKIDKLIFSNFLKSFSEYAYQNHFVSEFIRFDANIKNYNFYSREQVELERETVYVDLSNSLDTIWNNFSDANHRAIKKAEKNKFTVFPVSHSDCKYWESFFKVYNDEMYRKNAPTHLCFPLSFFLEYKEKLKNNTILIVIEKEKEFCGGFIIIFDNHVAYHFLSATLPKFWPERINNLLFYNAILWAKEKELKIFDFQGGRKGVYKFKTNFSQSRREFYTYKKIHLNEIYLELSSKLSNECTSYFPAYRNVIVK